MRYTISPFSVQTELKSTCFSYGLMRKKNKIPKSPDGWLISACATISVMQIKGAAADAVHPRMSPSLRRRPASSVLAPHSRCKRNTGVDLAQSALAVNYIGLLSRPSASSCASRLSPLAAVQNRQPTSRLFRSGRSRANGRPWL